MNSDPINNGWTIARSALLTHQQRLNVTANNIANVNTPGYSRRQVQLAEVPETPSSIPETRDYSKGAGVRVADVVRAQSTMTTQLLRQQTSDASGHETRADALGSLEALMREDGDSSLNSKLDAFWNAWSDLSNQADNIGFRSVVIQRGSDVATHFNSLYERINTFEQEVVSGVPGDYSGQLPSEISQFNRLTEELQDLNVRIHYALSGFEPTELMDRRDLVLNELSELANVSISSNGEVQLDGQIVVSEDGSTRNTLDLSDAGPPPVFEVDGEPVTVRSGVLSAWSDVLDISAGLRDRLDLLAMELADAVNEIHNSDRNVSGDSYDLRGERCDWDFFTGSNASDIAVHSLLYDPADPLSADPYRVAAAASRYDAGPPPQPNAGDGARALEMADLARQARSNLNEQTFSGYHSTGQSLLGGMIQTERDLADDGKAILGTLNDALQSEVGVNMDEELMDMMLAQRAFQAAGKLLQTVDEMMQVILQF
jgi:flagellar hook-associated protein 1 FlgK